MRLVPFSTNSYTDDKFFIIDEEDYEKVSRHKWRLNKHRNGGGNRKPRYQIMRGATVEELKEGFPQAVYLHRFILDVHMKKTDLEIDHINKNTLDNRKSNLREVTRSVNQRNKSNSLNVGLGLWGAYFDPPKNPHLKQWVAGFYRLKKSYRCGRYNTELEAHEAAKTKFKELFGIDK